MNQAQIAAQNFMDQADAAIPEAGDSRTDEARSELASALGRLRCHLAPDLAPVDLEAVERSLTAALDRLDRVLVGEDYIEKREALCNESNGAYHFTPPPDDALPTELSKGALYPGAGIMRVFA